MMVIDTEHSYETHEGWDVFCVDCGAGPHDPDPCPWKVHQDERSNNSPQE
jgi:hypothetical protein